MALSVMRVLAFIGLFLSFYALYVEYKATTDPDYVASCDIASWVSCSKVFTSEYAHVFYFPNAAYGAVFYTLIMVLDAMKLYKYIVYLSGLSFISTVYLAYILAFILHDMCVVCVSTYILNTAMFFLGRHYDKTYGDDAGSKTRPKRKSKKRKE